MDIEHVEQADGRIAAVVTPTTPVATLREAAALREHFDELLLLWPRMTLIDLTHLRRMDSGFIGELLACRKKVIEHRGALALAATGLPKETLVLAGLDAVFEIYSGRDEALRGLEPPDDDDGDTPLTT